MNTPTAERAVQPPVASTDGAEVERARTQRYPHGLDWVTVFWIGTLHLGALAAPFTFTWSGLAVALVLYWLTGGIGVCLGYHRLFSHRSFTTWPPIRFLIALCGGLAGEGSAVHWTANHRQHHALSDQPGDPHSPRDGFLWSHMFWCLRAMTRDERQSHHDRWVPDLQRERTLLLLDRTYIFWHLALGALLFGVGYLIDGAFLATSLVAWGMFFRLVVVLHCTWLINSVTHVWGYRNFETTDDSRNLWWVALLTFGEGWHNNHHAFPRLANFGRRWWEWDITYATIWLGSKLGLFWDVARESAQEPQA